MTNYSIVFIREIPFYFVTRKDSGYCLVTNGSAENTHFTPCFTCFDLVALLTLKLTD